MGDAGRETNLHEINICLCRYLRMQTHSKGGREGEKREREGETERRIAGLKELKVCT